VGWRVEYSDVAEKQLSKLGSVTENRIDDFLLTKIHHCEDPKIHGKALRGNKSAYWCYRVGDYRILCYLDEKRNVVMVDAVGHRRDIYDKS
jgi:mRNA interferase RelE/StbE